MDFHYEVFVVGKNLTRHVQDACQGLGLIPHGLQSGLVSDAQRVGHGTRSNVQLAVPTCPAWPRMTPVSVAVHQVKPTAVPGQIEEGCHDGHGFLPHQAPRRVIACKTFVDLREDW